MRYYCKIKSGIGILTLQADEEAIKEIAFGDKKVEGASEQETPLLERAQKELEEYFRGERSTFTVPIQPEGTEFQKKVWQALLEIPYGETRTYGEIAAAVGNPKASRAVGMANHNNPIPVIIPCHRVVGKNGSLTGYAGGLDKKTALLELERSNRL